MAHSVKEITSGAAKAVGGFREALQDLLVPEIRSLKASIDGLRSEMQLRDGQQTKNLDALREELRLRTDSLKEEIRMRDTNLREELRARDEKQEQAMKNLSEKLDFAIDIRERLVQPEARLPRTQ